MVLETRNLRKQFGDCVSVADVSLTFGPGLHAVVGENGAGKTTFLKLLFGLQTPTSGEIFLDGVRQDFKSSIDAIRAGIGMVQQHFTLVETLSVIDNIMLGAEAVGSFGVLNRKEAARRLDSVLPNASLSVPWDALVRDLSIGQRQRVEILKLLFRDSKALLLDEPTAVLAPQEISELFAVLKILRDRGQTIVVITHKLSEVIDHCDTYAVLRQGRLISQGEVAAATPSSIIEAMIGRALAPREVSRSEPRGEHVLRCKNLSENQASRGQLKNLNIDVRAGEIVGVAGVEGSGQSHFIESIMGLRGYSGSIEVLGEEIRPFQTARVRELGVGLIPEDRHHQALWLDESCRQNYMIGLEDTFIQKHLIDFENLDRLSREWSTEYDVRAPSLDVPVSALSGGNQQKLIFAREVAGRKPRLLICHQPTRGVDLAAIDLIYRKLENLRTQGLGILLVSSELDEILDICDRFVVMFDGAVTAEFSRAEFARGDFDRNKVGAAMMGQVQNA